MKIIHRIGFRATASQRERLEALGLRVPRGIVLPGGGDPLVAIDVSETHARWSALKKLFREWEVSDVARTSFTRREIDAAAWLAIVPDSHHGYPQPEDAFGYLSETYDASRACNSCGIGYEQRAAFRMEGEPKWGQNGVLQLNWVYDEYFVTPRVWTEVFRPLGITSRPVLGKKGEKLETVLQLVIDEHVGVDTADLAAERCSQCGSVKFLPVSRGAFPPLMCTPSAPLVKTSEYFGTGHSSFRAVLASQDVVRRLSSHGVRGVSFEPVEGMRVP